MSLDVPSPVVGSRIADLDTPCLLLDLDAVERNMDAMARAFAGTRVGIRPHAKTHKSPRLARMQLERGAVGICCAKLGEAEVLAGHGISGILITSELVGRSKIARLLGLAQTTSVITVVDDAGAARQISDAAVAAGLRLECLLDIDVGTNRTGVAAGEPAVALGLAVAAMPGLNLIGVQGYEGHLQHIVAAEERRARNGAAMQLLCQTAAALRDKGLPIQIVSTAGTGTCAFAAAWEGITEVQPGSYICMDSDYGAVDGLHFEYALTVLATVISKRNNGVMVDAGLKALSTDAGPARPKDLAARYAPRGDEHGLVSFDEGNPLSVGDKLLLIPSHCDPTINLHDVYTVTRGDTVVGVWPIAARGRLT
jgi:D-serine deaminase-like pyridoxal phosphate-dependent protein